MLKGVEETATWTTKKIAAVRSLIDNTSAFVQAGLPKIVSHELVQIIFEQPYCRIGNLVEKNIVKSQTAFVYLKKLCEIGVLKEIQSGKEKLFVHPKLIWAKKAKEDKKFQCIKWGVINRVFSAADPHLYSTILSESKVLDFIGILNNDYDLSISAKGNWTEQNISLMKAIKLQGLQKENIFFVNTFVWNLFANLVENKKSNLNKGDETGDDMELVEVLCENVIYYGSPDILVKRII